MFLLRVKKDKKTEYWDRSSVAPKASGLCEPFNSREEAIRHFTSVVEENVDFSTIKTEFSLMIVPVKVGCTVK